MEDVAGALRSWVAAGRPAALARVGRVTGFGARRIDEALAVRDDGTIVGTLLGASAVEAARLAARELFSGSQRRRVVEIALGDTEAMGEGLACGGSAEIVLQAVDTSTIDAVAASLRPAPRVIVVGDVELAGALRAQCGLLGWSCTVVDGRTDRALAAVADLGPDDVVVVLDHDPSVDDVIAGALRAGVGFVGALGSRHTQAARRDRLRAAGFDEATLDDVHGPVGLDIGARTPEETAVAVVAEVLADRAGRPPVPLRDTTGRINR